MSETITVALLGLGRIGSQFAAGLSDHIKGGTSPIKIVAVAEANPESQAAAKFKADGVPVYTDALKVVEIGDEVDVIFDLTGMSDMRQTLRESLKAAGNRHTVIHGSHFLGIVGHRRRPDRAAQRRLLTV